MDHFDKYTVDFFNRFRLDFRELNRRKRDTSHLEEEVILHIQTADKTIELELQSARPILDETSTIVFRKRDYVRTSYTEVPNCFYTGHVRNEPLSVASVGLCDHFVSMKGKLLKYLALHTVFDNID